MLLRELVAYSRRLNLPPQLYSEAPVRYIIELGGDGSLLSPQPTDTADPTNPRTKRGQRYLVPQVTRAVGIKPLLLADNGEYTLGLPRDESKLARTLAAHQAYIELLERCLSATNDPYVVAVSTFLHGAPADRLALPTDFDRGAAITFRVDGVMPIDQPAVQSFWATENDPAARDAPLMQCLVCGELRPVLERLQGKIKGIPGGQTSGTSLISANAAAFESYGLEASLIAPTCASCGELFTKAINDLIADRSSHYTVSNLVFIFWTASAVEFSFRDFLADPQPEQVRSLLESVQRGGGLPEVDESAFYACSLSASGGRAVVRDWIDSTIGEAQQQLSRWFARQHIVDLNGGPATPLGLFALAAATVRDPRTDLAPPTPRALLHTALGGGPLPLDLLYQAVRRSRAEQAVTRQRAALIKLVLLSRGILEEGTMVELDRSNTNAAYLCGRLLAELEGAQRLAIPGLKATIVDRFYGAASSAPASVFGNLLHGAQAHLSKLERDHPGAYQAIQQRLEEIMSGLRAFPHTLTLQDQGLFALGYYHQRAYNRSQARESAERRAGRAATAHEQTATDETDN